MISIKVHRNTPIHGVNGHVAVHSVNLRFHLIALGLLIAAGFSLPIYAQSTTPAVNVPSQINAANQLVRDGEIQAALAAYSAIRPDPSSQPQLDFNHAVALFRNGDIDAAQELFEEVAGSTDNRLAADASYNLGNCQYARSLKQIQQTEPKTNPAQIIEQLRSAIANYRGSLKTGDSGSDARANIELAAELIRQLEQQQEQNQEQPNQDQQQQEQNQEQQNQEQQNQEQQNQDQQNQDQEQKSDEQQGQQNPQQQGTKDPTDPTDPTNPSDPSDPSNLSKQENAAAEKDDPQKPMTREEAMKMLQAIRDRDMIRRFQKEQREQSRRVPVEKDW